MSAEIVDFAVARARVRCRVAALRPVGVAVAPIAVGLAVACFPLMIFCAFAASCGEAATLLFAGERR